MKKIICAIALLLQFGCGVLRDRGLPPQVAQDSVYKVKTTLRVDITELLPKEGEGSGERADPEFLIKERGPDSVEMMSDNTANVGWTGTGWVAAKSGPRSFIMTAGHVCESGNFFTIDTFDFDTLERKEVKLPIISKTHTLISREGIEEPVTVLADEDFNDQYQGLDLCLMGAQRDFGPAIPLADSDPAYGSYSQVIGAPAGLWGGNIAPTADLKFSGRGDVWMSGTEGLAFVGNAAGGNSGSPIMHDGRVVALLNMGGRRFPSLSTGVPWEVLRDFLRRHLHVSP